jgi:hypothetical protein
MALYKGCCFGKLILQHPKVGLMKNEGIISLTSKTAT